MRKSAPLPWYNKLGYSTAESGLTACELFLRIYLLVFFTEQLKIAPGLAGGVIAFGIIWDAITDPIMGSIYDKWTSRRFNKNGFLLIGGLLLSVSFYFLFSPPEIESELGLISYLTVLYLAVNTSLTIISVPHMAMTTALISDRNQRTSLFAYRFAAANFGGLFAMAYAGWRMSQSTPVTRFAFNNTALAIATLIFVSTIITYLSVRKISSINSDDSKESTPPEHLGFTGTIKRIASNKPFLFLFSSYIIASIGVAINSSLAIYYYRYRLNLAENDIHIILITFVFCMSLSLALWTLASYKFGKLRCLRSGILSLSIITAIMYPLLPPDSFFLPFWGGAVFLGFVVGCVILLDSMLTDVVDYDQIATGQSASGFYFGIWRFGSKAARAASVGLSGVVLQSLGIGAVFENVSKEASFHLALFFGPGVGIFLGIGSLMLFSYKFTDKKQIQVQRIKRSGRGLLNSSRISKNNI